MEQPGDFLFRSDRFDGIADDEVIRTDIDELTEHLFAFAGMITGSRISADIGVKIIGFKGADNSPCRLAHSAVIGNGVFGMGPAGELFTFHADCNHVVGDTCRIIIVVMPAVIQPVFVARGGACSGVQSQKTAFVNHKMVFIRLLVRGTSAAAGEHGKGVKSASAAVHIGLSEIGKEEGFGHIGEEIFIFFVLRGFCVFILERQPGGIAAEGP